MIPFKFFAAIIFLVIILYLLPLLGWFGFILIALILSFIGYEFSKLIFKKEDNETEEEKELNKIMSFDEFMKSKEE